MSKSIRFIGSALLCWVGVRAVSLGLVPGTRLLAFDAEASTRRPGTLPPIEPSILPAIEPVTAYDEGQSPAPGQIAGGYFPYPYGSAQPYPVYIPVPSGGSARSGPPQIIYVNPAPAEFSAFPRVDAPEAAMPRPPSATPAPQATPALATATVRKGLDRLSLSSWALMRSEIGPDSLANSGTLGGSEAGARLTWRYDPRLALTLRTSAPVNSQRGMEGALGIRYQPFMGVPVALTLERRRAFQAYGRNAFALFAEGGVYGRPMPWQATLDGYFQAGVVDFNNPDWFIDAQLAMTRPVWRNFSAGFGAWGGAQPGLNRFDIGPRLSVGLHRGVRAHADYRLHVAGNAQPASGAALTLAADF